ncbi:MAG: TolB family protein [Armatimonadota bacterium]
MKASLAPCRLPCSVVRFALTMAVVLPVALCLGGCGPVAETSWSPDDREIAYLDNGTLRILDLETRQSRALDTGPGAVFSPSWSPDGKTIAFYSYVKGKEGTVSLCAIDVASVEVRTLASNIWPLPTEVVASQISPDQSPEEALEDAQREALLMLILVGAISWSPDSARLACSAASATGGSLLLVDSATAAATPIVQDRNALGLAAWSPDGKRLAYLLCSDPPAEDQSQANEPPGKNSLWVHDLATGTAAKVYELPHDSYAAGTRLEWSADSTRIGFTMVDSHNEGRAIAYTITAQPEAVAREEMLGITPIAAWSPGLNGVVFIEQREGNQWVLIYRGLRPRTRQALGVLSLKSNDEDDWFSLPQFSHDGRKVALRVGKDPFPMGVEVFEIRRATALPRDVGEGVR